MCLNPLEISYSHIAEITLQDAPNVISQGFSTSICCQGETLTSNIMDFCLFPPLSSSLMLFPSQSLFCPLLEISFLLSLLWTQALFQVYVINLAKQFYRRDHSHTEAGLRRTCYIFSAYQPWRKARQFQFCVVTL